VLEEASGEIVLIVDVLAMAHMSEMLSCGWKLDSGATQHICYDISLFSGTFSSYGAPKVLQVGKAKVFLTALGEGTILLQVPSGPCSGEGALSPFTLTRAWFCPECPFNLISVRRVVEDGSKVVLSNAGAAIVDPQGNTAAWLELDRFGLYTCQGGAAGIHGSAGAAGAAGAVVEDPPADMCKLLFSFRIFCMSFQYDFFVFGEGFLDTSYFSGHVFLIPCQTCGNFF
jgi:hypothetical protein